MRSSAGVQASVLCAPWIDGPRQQLHVAHRSREAIQLATDKDVVAICVISPAAVRLPHAVVVSSIPWSSRPVSVGGGIVEWDHLRFHVSRWWRPARPVLPRLHRDIDTAAARAFAEHWDNSLGRGEGLTPYADDVICGSLVALHAAGHSVAAKVSASIRRSPLERCTTATSASLIRLAADGWCIDQLARYLTWLASGGGATAEATPSGARTAAEADLAEVGHSSGRGLVEGVRRMLWRREEEVGQ